GCYLAAQAPSKAMTLRHRRVLLLVVEHTRRAAMEAHCRDLKAGTAPLARRLVSPTSPASNMRALPVAPKAAVRAVARSCDRARVVVARPPSTMVGSQRRRRRGGYHRHLP